MILTNPKKPIVTGIVVALVISSLVVGGYFMYPYLYRFFNNIDLNQEVQLPESIKNSFGTYDLAELSYTPSIIPTPISFGLSNVDLQGLGGEINSEIKSQLEQDGFALVDAGIEDIFIPMYYDMNLETPMYISTDFCLHVLHSMFDNCLRIMELEYFFGTYNSMISTLREEQIDLYATTINSDVKTALESNIAYLSVLMYLLDNSTTFPSYVNSTVTQELYNIENGIVTPSAIFSYDEDFSMYKPRGHYTKSDALTRYFQSVMYAGRMGFLLDDGTIDNTNGIRHTRMALALVFSFSADVGGNTVWELWDKVCRTTNFLVGGSDDLTPSDYLSVWEEDNAIDFSLLSDDTFIEQMIVNLQELRAPKINSRYEETFEGEENATKGFKLFGQSYTPDAYIFQELVNDDILDRIFPEPLDILSVFGSERAEYHLDDEKSYTGYEEKIELLRNEFGNLSISDWAQNVYWQWLYALLPLLDEKGDGYPGFMVSDTWTDKALITALASWVELKHDTVLYAKSAFGVEGMSGKTMHYVEPYPKVYSRISATLKMLKEGLEARDVLYENQSQSPSYDSQIFSNFTLKFDVLIDQFDTLTALSIKILENQELTNDDLEFIHKFGKRVQYAVTFEYGMSDYAMEADKRSALIADVFTDSDINQVLEVAVGNPFLIYVVVQDHLGDLYLTRGVTFSYYDFKQPSSNRLTDQQWIDMLDSTSPDHPDWITSNLTIIDHEVEIMLRTEVIIHYRKK